MSTKAQRFAAACFDGLAEKLAQQRERDAVTRVTKWEGAGGSFANLQRDYERYGPGARAWFGKAEMRFFGTRLESKPLDFPALGVTLFLTSETPPDAGREWSMRVYVWASADIDTISGFGNRTDSKTAQDAFDLLWRVLASKPLA